MTDENNAGGESSRHSEVTKASNPVLAWTAAIILAFTVVVLMAIIIANQGDDEGLAAVQGQNSLLLQEAYDHQAELYHLTDEVSRQGDLIAELTEQMAAIVPVTEAVKEQESVGTEAADEMSYFLGSPTDSDDMLLMMMLMMMFSNIAQEGYYEPGWFDDSYGDCNYGYDSCMDPYSSYGFDIGPPDDSYYPDTEEGDYPQYGMVPEDFPGTAEDWALLEELLEALFGTAVIG